MDWIAEFICLVAAHLTSPFFKSSFFSIVMRMKRSGKVGDKWKSETYEELVHQVERNVKSSLMYFAQGDMSNAKRQATDAATYSVFLMKKINDE